MSPNGPFLFGAPAEGSAPSLQQLNLQEPFQVTRAQQPAQMAGFDMSLLSGITPEQLMHIGRLFQSGALTLPSSLPNATQVSPTTMQSQHAQAQAFATKQQDMAVDLGMSQGKENGTPKGGELGDVTHGPDLSRPPPTSLQIHAPALKPEVVPAHGLQPSPTARPRTHLPNGAISRHSKQFESGRTSEAASKLLLQHLHKAGYTFDQIAAEVGNIQALRTLCDKLDLWLDSSQAEPSNSAQQFQSLAIASPPSLGVEQRHAPPVGKRPAPVKTTGPQDRDTYLAKLKAAKSKRPESVAAVPTNPVPSKVAPIAEPAMANHEPTTPSPAVPAPPPVPAKQLSAKNELIRKRLEALKAAQARKIAGSSQQAGITPTQLDSAPTPSNMMLAPTFSQAAGSVPAAEGVSTPPRPPQSVPAVNPWGQTYGSLPGLFMSSTAPGPIVQPPTPDARATPNLVGSAAELVAPPPFSNGGLTTVGSGMATPSRSFGQDGPHPEPESFIITDSDSDDDDEMDMDVEEVGPRITNFGQTPFSSGSSLPGTPLAGNESSHAELKRKLQDIEEIKQKLAEAQKRQKIGKTSMASVISSVSPQSAVTAAMPSANSHMEKMKRELQQRLRNLRQQPTPIRNMADAAPQPVETSGHGDTSEGAEDEDDLDEIYEKSSPASVVTVDDALGESTPESYDESPVESEHESEVGRSTDVQSATRESPLSQTGISVNANTGMTDGEARVVDWEVVPELHRSTEEQSVGVAVGRLLPGTFYRPYESPLAQFKDYRYHSHFLDTVAKGHTSLTFTHRINPFLELCRHEAMGDECSDEFCEDQHFRDMSLSDNDLLRIMGAEHMPHGSPEQQTKWRDGLSALIRQLRTSNTGKDAASIAARITEYRREFLEDPTRVLRNIV